MNKMPDMSTRLKSAMEYLNYCAKEGSDLIDTTNMPTEDIITYAEDLMNRADFKGYAYAEVMAETYDEPMIKD